MELLNNLVISNDKKIEFITNKLLRIYKNKSSDRLIRLNINEKDVDLTKNEDDICFNGLTLSFDKNNCIVISKDKEIIFAEANTCPSIKIDDTTNHNAQINLLIKDKAYIYGLGDKAAFLNKYGYQYDSWNTDDPTPHNEQYRSLYKSINFFMVNIKDNYYGIFYPCTYKSTFDFGKTNQDIISIVSNQGEYDYFLVLGNNPLEIMKEYSSLVHRPIMPRLKMLGNQQSRWSYMNEEELSNIVSNYKKYNLPLDYVHMDIDYMDEFANLTINKKAYPDLKGLSDQFKKDGVEIVAIYDAGVKVKNGYFFYDNLVKNKLVLTLDKKPYVNVVWPGDSIFPNYFDSECREYIANEVIHFEEEYGISGIWCDMNEPASFNGPLPLEVEAKTTSHGNVTHDEFHNMYGEYMTRCIAKTFSRRNIRPYVITRACFGTASQYTTVWNGDNQSLWSHLEASLPQVMSMNICNFPFDGVDVGGFNCDTTKELLIRWIEADIFNPFLRNHSSQGTKAQEPWAFDKETLDIYRKMLNLRYELAPYLYDLGVQAHTYGSPIIRPLFVNYPNDSKVKEINDEIMIGESLLYAPIVHQGQKSRIVYLPKGKWYNYFTHEVIEGGKEFIVHLALDEVALYVKEGSILPKYKNVLHLDKESIHEIIFDCSYGDGTYLNYEDDGYSLDYQKGEYNLYEVKVENKKVNISLKNNGYQSPYNEIKAFNGDLETIILTNNK